VIQLCHEAAQHRFACAMVNPFWVATAADTLAGTGVPVGVVIGFPLGATLSASKRDETARVVKLGAHDVDMVLNVGLLKSGTRDDYEAVRQDIRGVVELAHGGGAIVKVILETCLLTFEEKLRASEIALAAGADFIKTSTGFSTGGATTDDITLMRGVVGSRAGVKASGGIRTLADATAMLHAGASRIGASASVRIVAELAGQAQSAAPANGY
jgi:deoxyribose-phosphate aldolase